VKREIEIAFGVRRVAPKVGTQRPALAERDEQPELVRCEEDERDPLAFCRRGGGVLCISAACDQQRNE